ncbi:MAG: tripartite tricarboxylate transporter TctB family protein [Proteobacteria bacterium]|nr:tripartite tricarboxylate transporter TctB family protein [Pseudomonadota bacterium]
MKVNDAILGAVFAVLGIAVLWHVQSFPAVHGQRVGPALFPGLIAGGLIVASFALIVQGLRERGGEPWFAAPDWWRSPRHVSAFLLTLAAPAFYIVGVGTLGFFVVSVVVLASLFIVLEVRPLPAIVIAVVATAVIWYAFYKLLRVPLPWGFLQAHAF